MKFKRMFVLVGVVALMGLLWATPAGADSHLPSITLDPASVPAEEGDVTITVTGANWGELVPFFITTCPGAQGDPTVLVDAIAAISNCPTITGDVRADLAWEDGGFTTEMTVTITQSDIDAGGLVVLAGWLSASTSTNPEDGEATFTILGISDESMDDTADEEPMDDTADEEPMDDTADEEPTDDTGEEELAMTGSESSLLFIVGASVLAAGLLVIGTGRRVRAVTR